MSLYYRETGKGLFVPERDMDELAMQRALEQVDDRLVLAKEIDVLHDCWVYKVVKRVSDDQPVVDICSWRDDYGAPLPLSSGLVDMVQRLRPENRHQRVDADEHNARLTAKRKADADTLVDDISHAHRKLVTGAPDPHHLQGPMHKPKRFGAGA